LADVRIDAVQEDVSFVRTTYSQRTGDFALARLSPGRYTVTATLSGFQKEVRRDLILNVGEKAVLNFILLVGPTSQEITVTGEGSLLNSASSEVGMVIDRQKIGSLPLNSREFLQLSLLAPGVNPAAEGSRLSIQANSGVNVNGARETSNNFLLDGVDNNDLFLNRFVLSPSLDAIQEFKLQASTYDAEFGRSGGGQVNVATRSGTNDWHGSLFEYFRNSVLDAKNFFDPPDQKTPRYQRNQFGGSVGGPVRKDQTFFFLNYEGLRTRRAETRLSDVPTVAQKSGDFSGTGITLLDPFTRSPFPENKIPQDRIHPVGRNIAQLYPDPNRSGPGGNFISSPIGQDRVNQVNGRFDYRHSLRSTFFSRYSFSDRFEFDPFASQGPNIPGFGTKVLDRGQNFVLGHTYIFSPSTLNDWRFGYNRLRREVFQENVGTDVFGQLGLAGSPADERDFGYPSIQLAGYETLGDDPNIPIVRRTGTYHFSDTLSYQRGGHFFKFGGEVRHYLENGYNDLFARGQMIFQPAFSGDALGDLLLGYPVLTISAVNDNPQALRTTAFNVFLQDDFKLHPRLTLNLGLRYEYNSPPVDAHDRLVFFDVASQRLIPAGQQGVPRSGIEPDRNNIAPRVGFSWDPTGSRRWVVRSGYGVYYDIGTLIENESLYFNPPYFQLNLFFTSPSNLLTLSDPFPTEQAFSPLPSPITMQRDYRTAYVQQWNFSLERLLTEDLMLRTSYVGSKGTHLILKRNLNQPQPGPGDLNERRPYQGFADILSVESNASSTYHSFQVFVEKRYSGGLSLTSAYTFSKSIDNSSAFLESTGNDNTPQNSFDLRAERGLSDFDTRHRFSSSFIYLLPFGKGNNPSESGIIGWMNHLIRNWQANGIVILQSGQPFTPRLAADNSNTGNVGGFFAHDRPNLIGNPQLENPTPERFFDTTAFQIPVAYTFGNAGRDILIGPGYHSVDLALSRDFSVSEKSALQLRVESFNTLNHPNFNLPESFADRENFGRIRSAKAGRQLQLAIRFVF
jgi:hypothetical protein